MTDLPADGRWFAYRPLKWSARAGHHAGGETLGHLVAHSNEEECRITLACGKDLCDRAVFVWFPMAVPTDAHLNRNYCARCLRTVGMTKAKKVTDYQRSRLYRAENAAGLSGVDLNGLADAQAYADALMTADWTRDTFPGLPRTVPVRARGGRQTMAHANAREIALGKHTQYEYLLLHELAHTIHRWMRQGRHTPGDRQDNVGHGPVYAGILLALVGWAMGKDVADALRTSFHTRSVDVIEWTHPTIRRVS